MNLLFFCNIVPLVFILLPGLVDGFAPLTMGPKVGIDTVSSRMPAYQLLHSSPNPFDEDPDVQVQTNIMNNLDPVTICLIGLAAIAFNFFVLANMGDGGIGGIVARFINEFG